MIQTAPDIQQEPHAEKQRHGCLAAFLLFMIISNSATVILYLGGFPTIWRNDSSWPTWLFAVLILGACFNLACLVGLLRWKKWGFWGLAASAVVAFVVNVIIGVGVVYALLGFLGVAILYAVLQIGNGRKGWSQLE